MTTVRIEADTLVVELDGIQRLLALKRRLAIPLAHVRGATPDPGVGTEPPGVRVGGTRVSGVVTAGSYRRDGERVFWNVRDAHRAVVIELRDEAYARLVVEVDDPRATADLVATALR